MGGRLIGRLICAPDAPLDRQLTTFVRLTRPDIVS